MITRIEIDGFKTFQDFSLDLAPFQVIIGPNGCGKSNLFDAIRLLSLLLYTDLTTAFHEVRDEPHELFTQLGNGETLKRMCLSVEMQVKPTITDEWGDSVDLQYTRLRYTLEIGRHNGTYSILGEHLASQPSGGLFINTILDKNGNNPTLFLLPERAVEKERQLKPNAETGNIERTLLSRVNTTEYPHVLAVREEMRRWHRLQLSPASLRKSSESPGRLDGLYGELDHYLAYTLARLRDVDPDLLHYISLDLANFVSGMQKIDVEYNRLRDQYDAYAITQDGRTVSLTGMSDGTIRLLALAMLRNNPKYSGVLCIEEPENGVHPGVLKKLVRLLRDMSNDGSDPELANEPLRQVLVTTHSTELVSHLDLSHDELIFAEMATRVIPGVSALRVTKMYPVRPDTATDKLEKYALARVVEYLNNPEPEKQRDSLREAFLR